MLDRWTMPLTHRPLKRIAQTLHNKHIAADQVTLCAFVIGMAALPLLAWEQYGLALVAIVLNRLGDGLDGALARLSESTSNAGGFLDIGLDFVFYAAVVLGFALANPAQNALAACLLLFAFIGTGTSFLAFAIAAKQQAIERPNFPNKAFYYLEGLTEGTETVLALVVFCLFPDHFPTLATLFATACLITTATRLWGGYWTLRRYKADL
ncbi:MULTISPECIES: CDP-alcohol phosphatidyltransferase family protein [Halomonadaceae]|uniref:CDP-alcohol phosphatidyltransferase family protein n=1 Tax=Vreelandella titanicae TaxID=664683 RepID=A0A558J8B2_9GAMM|nr:MULTISPECIES: CDP-alcohol phosphatidyltransferase family protein [Halomonas]MBR9902555.1 CDP-alcohol phosphatidyltransferase family protein [Gammaproteobacteria bacterium]TVU89871.1 CDP-alcohol phosphatidyltransferase family protein [Halomonas titanicae]CEP35042.1 Phosphatidylglycerophosphate synthase [Halomonas sp. R57-5]